MTSATPRFFLYARKSTDDTSRQVRSIGDQIAEVRELARRERVEIVQEFIEKQSAKAPGRPVFKDMLDRIERGEALGILAWHPDRLARNALDAGRIIHLVDTGRIKDLKFPTYRFESSANGKFMLGIMLSQSKYYIDNLSENIARGKRQKAKDGIWPQAAPLGYLNDRRTRTIVPDPVHGPLVTRMFELYASGRYGLRELRDRVVELGLLSPRGKPPSTSKVQTALGNPLYYGVIRYKGEFYEGKHTPLVGQALFDECKRVMHGRGRFKSSGHQPFLYRGLIRCGGCGCLITLEAQRGGRYRYVRCTRKRGKCVQPYTREEVLRAQIDAALGLISLSERTAEEIFAGLDALAAAQAEAVKAEQEKLKAEIASCDQRLERLLSLYLDNAISVEEYRATKNALILERHRLAETLNAQAGGVSHRFEQARALVRASLQATSVTQRGDAAESLRLFESVGLNMTLRDRRLAWEPRGDWQRLVGERVVEMGAGGSGCALSGLHALEREEEIKR